MKFFDEIQSATTQLSIMKAGRMGDFEKVINLATRSKYPETHTSALYELRKRQANCRYFIDLASQCPSTRKNAITHLVAIGDVSSIGAIYKNCSQKEDIYYTHPLFQQVWNAFIEIGNEDSILRASIQYYESISRIRHVTESEKLAIFYDLDLMSNKINTSEAARHWIAKTVLCATDPDEVFYAEQRNVALNWLQEKSLTKPIAVLIDQLSSPRFTNDTNFLVAVNEILTLTENFQGSVRDYHATICGDMERVCVELIDRAKSNDLATHISLMQVFDRVNTNHFMPAAKKDEITAIINRYDPNGRMRASPGGMA